MIHLLNILIAAAAFTAAGLSFVPLRWLLARQDAQRVAELLELKAMWPHVGALHRFFNPAPTGVAKPDPVGVFFGALFGSGLIGAGVWFALFVRVFGL